MSIVKWSPFLMPSWAEEMEKMMSAEGGFVPAVDVYETKDSVMVETSLAGVDPKDVEISVQNGILSIKGETQKESEVDDKNYYRKEVREGSFYRQVAMPCKVLEDEVSAEFENGLLKIRAPKAQEFKSKKINVRVIKKSDKK